MLPPKPTNKNKIIRKKIIKVSVSDDEYKELKKLSNKKPIAKFLREAALLTSPDFAKKEATLGYDENLFYEFHGLTNNLNQITKQINRQIKIGNIDKADFNSINQSILSLRNIGFRILNTHNLEYKNYFGDEGDENAG